MSWKILKTRLIGLPYQEMTPYYRGFNGSIHKSKKLQWETRGKYNVIDDKTVEIVELPIGTWTQTYKEFLDKLIMGPAKMAAAEAAAKASNRRTVATTAAAKKAAAAAAAEAEKYIPPLKRYHECHTEHSVKFVMSFDPDILMDLLDEYDPKTGLNKFERTFKLTSSIGVNRTLNFYNHNQILTSFDEIESVFRAYFDHRLELYDARRKYMIDDKESKLLLLSTRARFIQEANRGVIKINNVPKSELHSQLESGKYPKMFNKKNHTNDGRLFTLDRITEQIAADSSLTTYYNYDFLTDMPIFTLTKEKADELLRKRDETQAELDNLRLQSAKTLWEADLVAFTEEYAKFMKEYAEYCGINPESMTTQKKKIMIDMKKIVTRKPSGSGSAKTSPDA